MNFNPGDEIAIRNNFDTSTRTVTHVQGDEVHYECQWADGTVHPGRAASIDVRLERAAVRPLRSVPRP